MDYKNHVTNPISNSAPLLAQCHCRSISLSLQPRLPADGKLPISVPLCHCSTCRHSTGLLCTSYMPTEAPPPSSLEKTRAYPTKSSNSTAVRPSESCMKRYFCPTCGCHIFRSRPARDARTRKGSQSSEEEEEQRTWEVATGVLSHVTDYVRIERHKHAEDTKDGGLSIWITEQHHHPISASPGPETEHGNIAPAQSAPVAKSQAKKDDFLRAHCACGTVRFHLTRPTAHSMRPQSPFPDLMRPYHAQDARVPNAGNEKWWLRTPDGQSAQRPEDLAGAKYLAGTCACRSCRLTSGFEIQTWAFVPRGNIFFDAPRPEHLGPDADLGCADSGTEEMRIPLDFDVLRKLESEGRAVLKGYESSEGVMREFCPGCGATVFWHDRWRPEVVDVSVGLFDAGEGARAEGWLEWWGGRVSFEEDAGRDGAGDGGGGGWDLIPALGRGLRAWSEGMRRVGGGKEGD